MESEDYKKIFRQNTLNEVHENHKRVTEHLASQEIEKAKSRQLDMKFKAWYNQPLIGYLIALIVFVFTVYQHFENQALTNQVDSLKKERDSLNIEVQTYKNQFLNLTKEIERNITIEK